MKMRALSLRPLSVGTPVLTITSPYLAHVFLGSVLEEQAMAGLRRDVQYGVLLDRLDANKPPQGVTTGRVSADVSEQSYPNGINACRMIDLAVEVDSDEIYAHDTVPVVRSALNNLMPNGQTVEASVNARVKSAHIASMYVGDDARQLMRHWAVFIGVDTEVLETLEQYDDPGALSQIDKEVFLDECERLPIDETDPAIQQALQANDQTAFIRRLREVWSGLPRFQPIALVVEDTDVNRALLKAAFRTVVQAVRQGAQNLYEDDAGY